MEEQLERFNASKGKLDDEGAMDWEAQKRRLLASLEADFDEDDEDDARDRLTVEEAVRKTDEAIAKKERELQRLERLLEEQSSNLGSMAVGAAAVADVLDKDEIILQERANLQNLQDEWRQKLRQAEIDISMQRAQIARERAELQEKTHELEAEANRVKNDDGGGNGKKGDGKPQRGRWLSRLGLKDNED